MAVQTQREGGWERKREERDRRERGRRKR